MNILCELEIKIEILFPRNRPSIICMAINVINQ